MNEYAATYDEIMRSMEFEEEQLTWAESTKVRCGGRPEIYFRKIGTSSKVIKPFAIGNSDDKLDAHLSVLSPADFASNRIFHPRATIQFSRELCYATLSCTLCGRQVKRALKAEIDEDAWATLHSAVSRPFPKPKSGQIAVKVINHYGDEVLKVYRVADLR